MAKKKRKRTTLGTKLAISKAVRDQIKHPSKSASPGVKARARNIIRTGQAVPVKGGKRTPTQTVRDRRAKRRAKQVRGS